MIILAAALAALAPTVAGETPATAPSPAPKEKQVCRKEQSATSRMVKRVCKTQAEWDAQPDDAIKLSGRRD